MIEEFKDIKNYEGIYQISNLGNVKSLERKVVHRNGFRAIKERVLKINIDKAGYLKVVLQKDGKIKNRTVHSLVAQAFLGHEPCGYKLVINHINFNKLDNRVENLEIITQRENTNLKHIKRSSKYVGVTWSKKSKKWQSQIGMNGKQKYLGCFDTEIEASNAYQKELLTVKQ